MHAFVKRMSILDALTIFDSLPWNAHSMGIYSASALLPVSLLKYFAGYSVFPLRWRPKLMSILTIRKAKLWLQMCMHQRRQRPLPHTYHEFACSQSLTQRHSLLALAQSCRWAALRTAPLLLVWPAAQSPRLFVHSTFRRCLGALCFHITSPTLWRRDRASSLPLICARGPNVVAAARQRHRYC